MTLRVPRPEASTLKPRELSSRCPVSSATALTMLGSCSQTSLRVDGYLDTMRKYV